MSKNYQSFKKLLFNPKVSKKILFKKLKTDYTFNEQQSILKQLPKPFLSFITGNCLMKDMSALWAGPLAPEYDFKIHLNWYCHQIKHYYSHINQFLSLRKEYEKSFLLARYSESQNALTMVKESISCSHWSMENDFLQVQYEKGLEFNFKLLNASQKINVKDPAYYFLLHFFSYKVEEDVSYFNYETVLKNSYNGVPENYVNFLSYRLDPMTYAFGNLDQLFAVYSNYSILDKYLLIRDVMVQLCNDERSQEDKNICLDVCLLLNEYIEDPLLLKVISFLDKAANFKELIDLKKNEIIDLYTKGKYREMINLSLVYLREKPNDFSILELFVKSHIHLQLELTAINPEPCFLDDVSSLVFIYLNKKEDPNEAFLDLLTQANAISNFDFSQEIVAFLERSIKVDYFSVNKKGYFYSDTNNPFHFTIFKEPDRRISYLVDRNDNSLTNDFFLNLITQNEPQKTNEFIPDYRKFYYSGITHFTNGDYETAKHDLEQILEQCKHVGFLHELVVNCLFKSYVALSFLDLAIDLYVETYLINEKLILRIDSSQAVNEIVNKRFKNVRHENVNFPIFIYHTPNETHTKFIAYDLFMRAVNAGRPTEFFNALTEIKQAEILFLRIVASSKIISRKAMIFKNSLEVSKERIEICQALSKIDIVNLSEYTKEISELTQRLTVQQRIKEIDQSMIYVDENGIIGHELGEINKAFTRFRNISELMNLNKIDVTGISYDALIELLIGKIDRDTYKKSIRKTDMHFELFIQLFIQIRDKFLFSNYYGLDYYLSQRIRHGTIIGQLRKQFQELNLVTSKSSEDEDYLPNKFWSDQLGLEGEIKQKFEIRMAKFSSNIDGLIMELKNQSIQIKTEDAKTVQSGWFDYMYIPNWNRDFLYSLFISKIQLITDFNEFVNSIFEVLWDMTTQNLQLIRKAIDNKVKANLITYLDDLEADLMVILVDSQPGKMMKNIADCRTNVQSEVDTVIRWFNRSKNDEIDFTLADAFNTSLKIVNNINSPFIILFTESLEKVSLFKGAFFTHFVDLLKIFITNIFNYFKENNLLHLPADVQFDLQGDILIVKFTNSLAEDGSYEKLHSKVEGIKLALLSTNYSAIRGEVKSGFYKANNVLKNVFRDQSNEIIFDLDEKMFNVKIIISVRNLLV